MERYVGEPGAILECTVVKKCPKGHDVRKWIACPEHGAPVVGDAESGECRCAIGGHVCIPVETDKCPFCKAESYTGASNRALIAEEVDNMRNDILRKRRFGCTLDQDDRDFIEAHCRAFGETDYGSVALVWTLSAPKWAAAIVTFSSTGQTVTRHTVFFRCPDKHVELAEDGDCPVCGKELEVRDDRENIDIPREMQLVYHLFRHNRDEINKERVDLCDFCLHSGVDGSWREDAKEVIAWWKAKREENGTAAPGDRGQAIGAVAAPPARLCDLPDCRRPIPHGRLARGAKFCCPEHQKTAANRRYTKKA